MTGGADGGDCGRIDLDRPWRQVPWVAVDVEGNGQRPPDLVEAACLPVDAGAPGSARTWLVRPPRPITRPVRRIHGISNADVAASPAISVVAGEIRAALAGRVVIGHHVHVDLAVLSRELAGWVPSAYVDTLRLAKAVWPGLPSYGLDNLARAAQLPPPATGKRHRAGYDAALTAALFLTLASSAGSEATAAQLLALAGGLGAADDTTRLF